MQHEYNPRLPSANEVKRLADPFFRTSSVDALSMQCQCTVDAILMQYRCNVNAISMQFRRRKTLTKISLIFKYSYIFVS